MQSIQFNEQIKRWTIDSLIKRNNILWCSRKLCWMCIACVCKCTAGTFKAIIYATHDFNDFAYLIVSWRNVQIIWWKLNALNIAFIHFRHSLLQERKISPSVRVCGIKVNTLNIIFVQHILKKPLLRKWTCTQSALWLTS